MIAAVDVMRGAGLPAGDAKVQRDAEATMVAVLAAELGVSLRPATIDLGGHRVEVDAADDARTVLVEAWAHQSPPKGAQRNKVLTDAFKLTWVRSRVDTAPRLILLLSDVAAARSGRGMPRPLWT